MNVVDVVSVAIGVVVAARDGVSDAIAGRVSGVGRNDSGETF